MPIYEQYKKLLDTYTSPLYLYDEKTLRTRCREMKTLVTYKNFKPSFSMKANSNLTILKIAHEEGLQVDCMSPGEIIVAEAAGFLNNEILYISNNATEDELKFAIDKKIKVSVDSLSQLELYGQLNPNSSVFVRINAGIGAGHHEKVVTAGKNTKFGINADKISAIKNIANKYNIKVAGLNQHIGSLFLDETPYIESVKNLLMAAKQFEDLEYIDMGGGFGMPYVKAIEPRLDLKKLGEELDIIISKFVAEYGKQVTFKTEPGRYVVAECGSLLAEVTSIKNSYNIKYVGCNSGFTHLIRPIMYDSYHEIDVISKTPSTEKEVVTVVGNICESGDIFANDRLLPIVHEGDIIRILDAGAYGYSMSSNYNSRLRPAEVMLMEDGSTKLIRKADTYQDLLKQFDI